MSVTKWSPEPWRPDGYGVTVDANGSGVFHECDLLSESDEATARRIRACVNALAGIPTAALEAGRLGEALLLLSAAWKLRRLEPAAAEVEDVLRSLGRLP